MSAAVLQIEPRTDQVRTARLVAVAAARQAGLDDSTVDDVRLAVGEAVTRAVLRSAQAGVTDEIAVTFTTADDLFTVTVADAATSAAEPDGGVALAVAVRLATGGEHRTTDSGSTVHLLWPAV